MRFAFFVFRKHNLPIAYRGRSRKTNQPPAKDPGPRVVGRVPSPPRLTKSRGRSRAGGDGCSACAVPLHWKSSNG